MVMSTEELKMRLCRKVTRDEFLRTERTRGIRPPRKGEKHLVSLETFTDTLEQFETAGQDVVAESDARELWQRFNNGDLLLYVNFLFPLPSKLQERGIPTNRFGFAKPLDDPNDESAADSKRPEVGQGPLDPGRKGERVCNPPPLNKVPERINYTQSRTAVQPPTNWDTQEMRRSCQKPDIELQLEHVYGYPGDTRGSNLFYTSDGRLAYWTAAVGIVYHPDSNSQQHFKGHDNDITAMAVDPRGTCAVTGQAGTNPYCCVWDLGTCDELARFGEGDYSLQIAALCFSRDSRYIVVVGADNHHKLGVWEWQSRDGMPDLIAEMASHNGTPPQVFGVAWSPAPEKDGSEAFVTVGISHLKFWKFRPNIMKLSKRLEVDSAKYRNKGVQPRAVHCVAFNVAGKAVTGAADGRVSLWNGSDCVYSFQAHTGPVHCIATTARSLWTAGRDGMVHEFNLEDLSTPESSFRPENEAPGSRREGRPGAGTSRQDFVFGHNQHNPSFRKGREQEANYGDPSNPKLFRTRKLQSQGGGAAPVPSTSSSSGSIHSLCMLMSRGNQLPLRQIAIGSSKGMVYVTNGVKNTRPTLLFEGHRGAVNAVASCPRTASFVTVGMDRNMYVWDRTRRIAKKKTMLPAPGSSVDFNLDGRMIAVGLANGAFVVLEADTLNMILTKQDCREMISQIRYSPDGYALAVASHDNFIDIYDATRNYRRTTRCTGHTSHVSHLDWSTDSSTLQSNDGSYEIVYWNADTGRQIRSSVDTVEADTDWATWTCVLGFPAMGVWPDDSNGTDVNAVDRSHDRKYLASGDDFGHVKLFTYPCVVEDAPFAKFHGHSAEVTSVRFMHGDSHVVSVGGDDRSVLQWRVRKQRGQRRGGHR
jgi:WD40 repeat protein